MSAGTSAWWCEAYGPPAQGVDAAAWPRCFLGADPAIRQCASAQVCADVMTAERARVFDRIQQGAADGDSVMAMLAEDLTSPDELLGGAAAAHEGEVDDDGPDGLVVEGPHFSPPGSGFSSSGSR